MKSNKGLSLVVSALFLVLLTLASVGIIWVFVNNLIKEQIDDTQSCFGIFDKVTINNFYTCYDSSTKEVHFSISVKDLSVDRYLVLVSGASTSKTFDMSHGNRHSDLRNYEGNYNDPLILPGENSGMTYVGSGFSIKPNSIEISPVINGKTCSVSDTLQKVDDCSLL